MLTWIEIDGAAVRHNYRQFCQITAQERVAPVLKSNAYGHGLREVYAALSGENPAWLCTNYVAEARILRELGYKGRLLVVGPAVAREFAQAYEARAELVVGNWEVLAAWGACAEKPQLHVKIDTGMSRQGFLPDEVTQLVTWLSPHKAQVVGVCTHFSNVEDVTEHGYASLQLQRFCEASAGFRRGGYQLLEHAASSASTLLLADSRFQLVRLGICLYGVWPSQATRLSYLQLNQKLIELKPVLSWKTEITTLRVVKAGQFIGYGCTYRAVRDMRIAVLPIGYFEGYPRLAGGPQSHVLIRGERCAIVGRICMNMMMVDVSHVNDVAFADVVTMIGHDGNETLSAAEVAAWAQTIHYELLTRLNQDIPRQVIETP